MVEKADTVVDYGVFASLFKQRNGEYPEPFLAEVQSQTRLEVEGQVPDFLELQYFLTFGSLFEANWREAIYTLPRVAERAAFQNYARFSEQLPQMDVVLDDEPPRRGNRVIRRDILGDFVDQRGRATIGLIIPAPGRVSRVEFKHRPDYANQKRRG